MTVKATERVIGLPLAGPRALALGRLGHIALVSSICLLPALLLAPFFTTPMMNDEGIFATIAEGLLRGQLPYRDLFDIAPPAIYGWYAASFTLFGRNDWAPHVMLALVMSATTLLVYIEGRLLFSRRGASGAAIAFALSAGISRMGAWALHEYFALLPLMGALVAFTIALQRGRNALYLVAGLCCGLAFITNQSTAVTTTALALLAIWFSAQRSPRRWSPRHLGGAALLSAGFVLALLTVVIPYLLAGALGDLLYGAIEYPLRYGAELSAGRRVSLALSVWGRFLLAASPWLLLSVAGAVRLRHVRDERRLLLWSTAVAALVAVCLTGRFHIQYFALMFPAFALLMGQVVEDGSATIATLRRCRPLVALLAVSVALCLVYNGFSYVWSTPTARSIAKSQPTSRAREAESRIVGAYLRSMTGPNDTILNIGHQGELYFYADRRPAIRYFHDWPWRTDPRTIAPSLQEIMQAKPRYIVDTMWYDYLEGNSRVYAWDIFSFIQSHYVLDQRVCFDPGIRRLYHTITASSLGAKQLSCYADVYRLKDGE
jgi:hypothetical protein